MQSFGIMFRMFDEMAHKQDGSAEGLEICSAFIYHTSLVVSSTLQTTVSISFSSSIFASLGLRPHIRSFVTHSFYTLFERS